MNSSKKTARVAGLLHTLKVQKSCFLLAVAGCLLLAQLMMAEEGIKGNLVNVEWLKKNLNNADVVILDASFTQIYSVQHIPGAINFDVITYGIRETPVADMEKFYQSLGISAGKKIVIYDEGGGMLATKVFFSLYYHGYPVNDLLILDGGLFKWKEAGLSVTKDIMPTPKNGSFKIKEINEDVRVRLPEILTASGDLANNTLLEALDAGWHFGENCPFNRAGHIPFGILLPNTDFYNPDKTFKSAEEIKKMATYMGVKSEQHIYTYCGRGVAASVPFFALRFILNWPRVKLYVESEIGWLSDERELPYWTYDAPFLMRETKWLQFWNGEQIRLFVNQSISIVDVRSTGIFNQGHFPFALNIPSDVFKTNITNPKKLAEILGPAGVNASHEAVIVSGKGLTKESALAFVLLEKLGQKKVSIFMDSVSKWARLGFTITKSATIVGPKKGLTDLSIPPMDYPVNFSKDVIITDPKSTQGIYPKVFIASGKNIPSKAQDGKVVHVPYTILLNADGTPKAAKDIWNILAKAGVPRYGELVCFSDDPGESAINYFILKLMGYPDIKVLVF